MDNYIVCPSMCSIPLINLLRGYILSCDHQEKTERQPKVIDENKPTGEEETTSKGKTGKAPSLGK